MRILKNEQEIMAKRVEELSKAQESEGKRFIFYHLLY